MAASTEKEIAIHCQIFLFYFSLLLLILEEVSFYFDQQMKEMTKKFLIDIINWY